MTRVRLAATFVIVLVALGTVLLLGIELKALIERDKNEMVCRGLSYEIAIVIVGDRSHNWTAGPIDVEWLLDRVREREGHKFLQNAQGAFVDTWGNPLVVALTRQGDSLIISVRSVGKDGRAGTQDDLEYDRTVNVAPASPRAGLGN